MLSKKLAKLLVLSAIGVMGLTACDEIQAKPTDYNDPLVTDPATFKDVYHNIASVVYDAIRDGGVGDDVLNEVMYRYAQSVIGYFNIHEANCPDGAITLEDCYNEYKANSTSTEKRSAFIKAHKAYWTVNDDGKRVNDAGEVVADDAEPSESELSRVSEKYESILARIARTMYEKISSGSYSDRNIFDEAKFLRSLKGSMESVADPEATETKLFKGVLTTDVEPEEVFDGENPFLHRENYMGDKNNYVELKLIPEISRQLLNEQYLLDETYNTLGRSYARKVNVITIANNSEHPMMADYLAKHLVNRINDTANVGKDVNLDVFKEYSNVLVGVNLGEKEKAIIEKIYTDSNYEVFEPDEAFIGGDAFKGTEFGDLVKRYEKIKDDPRLTDTSAESEFTGNNAYTKEIGLELKTRELSLKKHTTTGWFIKNGGLTELPDSIRNRLFNIGVATGVVEKDVTDPESEKKLAALDRFQTANGDTNYVVPANENAYVARINSKYYLKTSSRIGVDNDPTLDILHYDSSSKTYYVVQIEEAISSSKLSKTSTSSLRVKRPDDIEEIINEVTRIVGTSESYSTLATKYYLEKMGLKYHDQTVYDYFKTNYPELFE